MDELEEALYALGHAMSVLYVDGATAAPKESWKGRGKTLAYLSELEYRKMVSDEVGEVLHTLLETKNPLDSKVRRRAELLKESYDDMHIMPMDEYVAFQELLNEADAVWHEAKEKSDYALFAPILEKLIDYEKRFATRKNPDKAPYDVLLDSYEKGASMASLDPFFKVIREDLSPLIARIAGMQGPDDSFLRQPFPIEKQRLLSHRVMEMEGINFERCTLGETEHPFTDGMNKWDCRITTHYHEDDVMSNLFSVIHEGGHALYDMGSEDDLEFTCLAGGVSMGVHESQSRFYENLICRSEAFCKALLPEMRKIFPEQMKNVTPEMFYRAINTAKPSLIRTEADELTYPIHVMIRYEIEKKIFAGEVTVKDLPALWNKMYKDYLGVDVPDDRHGILQDSHWSGASFGYFPSYALGSAYGVQMLQQMKKDLDVDAIAAAGDLRPITAWLHERIHRFGSLKRAEEVLADAMGGPLDPKAYTGYLIEKFTRLYVL